MLMTPVRGPDAARLLLRALLEKLPDGAGATWQTQRPWASATFSGTQHRLRIQCPDETAARVAADTLGEAEFALRGHVVAELLARADDATIMVDALTLVAA